MGHLAKAIDFAKWPKTCEKGFYEHIRVVLCKKSCIKTPNIREMRVF